MNNIENAIKTLKILYDTADVTTVEGIRLKRDIPLIIEVCKKQIAKNVDYSELNYSRLPVSKCPTCKSTTINKILSVNHCPDCGQKLDWSEAEDE